jgi:RNA polymerase sigma-70 factor (ECF subfamily)
MTRLARTLLYDDEEARDVVSEVFATLIKSDITPKDIERYLLISVRNRCLNLIEHKSVRAKFEQAYTLEMRSEPEPTDDDDRLRRVMTYAEQNLTEQTLRVFRMRHLQGMKYQEIAEELGISRVMVYKHLTQAMEKMREYYH